MRNHPWRVWLVAGAILLAGSLWALNYSASHFPERGMLASIFRGADPGGEPVLVTHDEDLDPIRCARLAGLDPRAPFSVVWQGSAVVTEAGRYHLRVLADDGASVWIDDQLALEEISAGQHELSKALDLAPGLHTLRVRYVQFTGDAAFHLSWAPPASREDFADLLVAPPADPPLNFRRVGKALHYPIIVAVSWSAWIAAGLVLAFFAALPVVRHRLVLFIALLSIALLGIGVGVGAAPWRNWAPDELGPLDVLFAASQWFGSGWSSLYPPVHFYLLSVIAAPFLLLADWGWLSLEDATTLATLHVVGRYLSVVMAMLTLVLTALIGEMTVGARRGAIAAVFLLSVPIFVFYGKTTNVDMPYLFWVALATLMLVRAIQSRSVRDYALLGAAVALAVATKDQAYGFFPGAAAVLLWVVASETPAEWSWPKRLVATVRDRRLWSGLLACIAVYVLVSGVLWNPEGVKAHFTMIVQGPQPFRMFPRTVAGIADLGVTTLAVLASTLGPVTLIFAIAGLTVAVVQPRRYRELLILLALLASYFLTFMTVVGYVYDRFLLGFALVAALFAALGLDAAMRAFRREGVRVTIAVVALALALLPSIVLNSRIVFDSRLRAEQWMADNLTDDPLIIGVGMRTYLPNLYRFRHQVEADTSPADVVKHNADVVVLNEQWLERNGENGARDMQRALTDAGYREVFAAGGDRRQSTWERAARAGTTLRSLFSNLEKISPPLSIWKKETA